MNKNEKIPVYIVVDQYEQRDGYFGLDAIFLNEGDAKKEAERLIKYNKEEYGEDTNHDVFEYYITK